jgi:hypothetical protein
MIAMIAIMNIIIYIDINASRYSDGVDGRGIGVRFPTGEKHFPIFHNFYTASGAHPASYNGYRGLFPWV